MPINQAKYIDVSTDIAIRRCPRLWRRAQAWFTETEFAHTLNGVQNHAPYSSYGKACRARVHHWRKSDLRRHFVTVSGVEFELMRHPGPGGRWQPWIKQSHGYLPPLMIYATSRRKLAAILTETARLRGEVAFRQDSLAA